MLDTDLQSSLSILVVDDMKFSCVYVKKVLTLEGFKDIRIANTVSDALAAIAERPCDVLLADWVMPEMDGLQLTAKVRELDQANHHYTGIILLTAKEGVGPLYQAFDGGVDDYLTKPPNNKEMAARTYATGRLSRQHNALLARLQHQQQQLEGVCTIDPTTQLDNERGFTRRVDALLQRTEARGGVVGVCLVKLQGADAIREKHGDSTFDEVLHSVARRMRRSVRPDDPVARIGLDEFVLAIPFDDEAEAASRSLQKLERMLNVKPVKSRSGFINLHIQLGYCHAHWREGQVSTPQLLSCCRQRLGQVHEKVEAFVPQPLADQLA